MLPNSQLWSRLIAVGAFMGFAFVAAAQGSLPDMCTTNTAEGGLGDGLWTVDVSAGPCEVSCSAGVGEPFCGSGTGCTGIEYTINDNTRRSADHVVLSTPASLEIVYPTPPASVFAPCIGDSVTGVGEFECHEQAVRLNEEGSTNQFRLVAQGSPGETLTSIVIKSGGSTESCQIKTLGTEALQDPNIQAVSTTDCFTFKGCTACWTFDPVTNEVEDFTVAPDTCETRITPASDILVELVGQGNPVPVIFGNDAIFTIGNGSCGCRIIGNRAYHWCD